jgi:CrcB protein
MGYKLYLLVGLGGALGSIARVGLSGLVASSIGETFPFGTLAVNIIGSFVIGFFGALTAPDGRVFVGSLGRQFVMAGLCGGFTTFSSFSLQSLALMQDGEWGYAGANVAGSVAACLVSVWLGVICANALNQLKGA